YQVMGEERVLEALKTNTIDYGEPNATADNLTVVNGMKNMAQKDYQTGGYGYIGINPAAVPDLEVRQAIMRAFNPSAITAFYGSSLVDIIHRPMSLTSWAYPKGATRYYERYTDEKQIRDLVTSSEKHTWIYDEQNNKIVDAQGNQLKLTFTIAGETTKHPAYRMLNDAADFLERCGMDIIVTTDVGALNKLATGQLEVGAAAWSSSIDPDPYQIYSIYSNASSTKNWNKQGILDSGRYGEFSREYDIAQRLAEKIDEGRSKLTREERIPVYHDCLDLIMDLAVEFPTYQRRNLCVYNENVLDASTMHISDASFNMGPIDELWKVAYKN
ncbi:MAG: hypothetical protein K2O67_03765, partial [Clostridia bacterium]|nr:hypothetical protein [Clostridia bacterium]